MIKAGCVYTLRSVLGQVEVINKEFISVMLNAEG